jgi:glycosyltransferase involved in cell wall biosynthesis
MSSRAEGLGLVLLEAASCGLPLIAFDCPSGPSEIVEDGKNGFLVEKVGDVQTMADRICHLIENEALRRQMGEKARQMVQRFSVETIRKQWMDLFDGM